MGEIYIAINEKNNKKYIGQAVCQLSNGRKWGSIKRWENHVKKAQKNICECRLLENAIQKYNSHNFTIIIIKECPIHELNYWEDYYIKKFDTIAPNGYNLMTGGGNGRIHSQETKNRMSLSRIGKKHSDIVKKKIGLSQKNKKIFAPKSSPKAK